MRTTNSATKKSPIAAVRTVASVIASAEGGAERLQAISYEEFYGLMLQFSPVKPYEFNTRSLERALRKVVVERR
jgi:hypothetical protein